MPRTGNDGGNSWKRLRSSLGPARDDDDDDDDDRLDVAHKLTDAFMLILDRVSVPMEDMEHISESNGYVSEYTVRIESSLKAATRIQLRHHENSSG